MIAYPIYKLIHLSGIFMVLVSLGGVIHHVLNGGFKNTDKWRKSAVMTHGIGLFLALLGGFGMLARLSIHWPWPGWVMAKGVIWLAFGGALALAYRNPRQGKWLWIAVLVLGISAAYLAIAKPF